VTVEDFNAFGIFPVSHQVYHESGQVFYAHNTFQFYLSSRDDRGVWACASFLRDRLPQAKHAIRSIDLILGAPGTHECAAVHSHRSPHVDGISHAELHTLLISVLHIHKITLSILGPRFHEGYVDFFDPLGWEKEQSRRLTATVSGFASHTDSHVEVIDKNPVEQKYTLGIINSLYTTTTDNGSQCNRRAYLLRETLGVRQISSLWR
jgi:hypothetical protein